MRVFTWLIGCFRAVIRMLMTDKPRVGRIEKAIRGAALVPVFGTMLILLRARAWLLGPLRIEATTRDGDRVACHLPDLIQMYLYLFGVWEPDLAAFVRGNLRPGDVFVDVGANIGFDSLVASRIVGESGAAVAIEASPAVYERLRETLRLNGSPTNIRSVNRAVAANAGSLEIYAGPAHNIGLTTTVQRSGMRSVARIDSAPLGELLTIEECKRVRLIKIDVEGGEDAVLAGMLESVERWPREVEIAVELSPLWWSDRSRTALDVLKPWLDRGFHAYLLANNYWPWRYLWPNDVRPPQRLTDLSSLSRPVKRLDVILSRVDAAELERSARSADK